MVNFVLDGCRLVGGGIYHSPDNIDDGEGDDMEFL